MKTEAEIRKYRDALRKGRYAPCDCAASGHDIECRMGGYMMDVAIAELSWVLGEAPERDRAVEEMTAEINRRGV